jgi:CBS domain-containing protein
MVRDVMTREPKVTPGDARVIDAARTMKHFDIGLLPVVEEGNLIGVVTDRDLIVRGMADGRDPRETPVRRIMSREPVCCREEQDLTEAGSLMQDHQLRRILVLDDRNKLAGICSMSDLATAPVDARLGGEVLRGVSMPSETPPLPEVLEVE